MGPAEMISPGAHVTAGSPALAPGARGRRFYRPELDVLRFFAFLSVFFCHGLPFAKSPSEGLGWRRLEAVREAGNFGVCLFFLLSSYLITELLRLEYAETGSVHLPAFYIRRSLRIWPLYFGVVLSCAAAGIFFHSWRMPAPELVSYLLFFSNWYVIATPAAVGTLNWLWSISVEEQFYIVWPMMAKLGGMKAIRIGSIAFLPISLLAVAITEVYQRHTTVNTWFNSIVQFQFFAVGALLAIFLSGRIPRLSGGWRVVLAVFGSSCWLVASAVCKVKSMDVDPGLLSMCIGYELVSIGCVSLFFAFLGVSTARVPNFIAYLGKISYGLYVFHQFALYFMTATRQHLEHRRHDSVAEIWALFFTDRVLSLFLTVGAGILSYRYIEKPFLKLKDRYTFVSSRPA